MASTSAGNFTTSWKTLTIIATCLTVASLTTLSTVVAINDVDLLSTVALTLAVIAFVAQLLIYIAQTAASSAQTAQNLALNTETKSLLTDIRARTGGTETVLKEQFNLVLQHALGRGLAEAGGIVTQTIEMDSASIASLGQPSSQGAIEQRAEEAAESAVSDILRKGQDDPILQQLLTYPNPEEARAAFEAMVNITPLALGVLIQQGRNEVLSRRIGRQPYTPLTKPAPISDSLMEAGFSEDVTPVSENRDQQRLVQLTALGRITVRLFTAPPPPPDFVIQHNAQYRIMKSEESLAE